MSNSPTHDVIIVGGGMVGAALACTLAPSSLSIAIIDTNTPFAFDPQSPPDLRVSAISRASENILVQAGAWEKILAMRACPYHRMSVWEDAKLPFYKELLGSWFKGTHFDSFSIAEDTLGHIVENRIIQLALWQSIEERDNVEIICPAKVESMVRDEGNITLTLDNQQQLIARLVVGADGANSQVRKAAHIGLDSSDYEQEAMLATLVIAPPQQDITWQRFTPTGPQAFLPLMDVGQLNYGSIVWYHSPDEISRLKNLPEKAFIEELTATFPERLPSVTGLISRGSFPLTRRHAKTYVKPNYALIGDAAHTINPLAGQGVNIGLPDAACLAEVLSDAHRKGEEIGELRILKRYERRRRFENQKMISIMDLFYHSFSNSNKAITLLRNLGLDSADHVKPLKNKIMRYAMGLNEKPHG